MVTLNKFGINVDGDQRGILQPKLKYKFRVVFFNYGGIGGGRAYTQNVVSVDRPKLSYAEVPIHSYNSVAYAMGKHEWATMTCAIRDDVSNDVVRLTGKQVQRQVDHHNQTSALSGADFKFGMRLDIMTGAANSILEQWELEGCFLTNVDYDGGDYSASEPIVVTLTVRFDNATHAGASVTDQLMPEGTIVQTTGGA